MDDRFEARDYKFVHDTCVKLNRIHELFIGNSDIYDEAWRSNIVRKVKAKVDTLAGAAKAILEEGETEAYRQISDFALYLVNLGRILDELDDIANLIQGWADMKISDVLQKCIVRGTWGGRYLFKVGLLLDRGEIGEIDAGSGTRAADDVRAGRFIVSRYSHFKAVRTISWNEEVPQMSVEATISETKAYKVQSTCGADGPVSFGQANSTATPIDAVRLMEGFEEYEKERKVLFDSWCDGTDKADIVHAVIEEVNRLRRCVDIRKLPAEVKSAIPKILAGVFTYFTIVRSGDDYKSLADRDTDRANTFADSAESLFGDESDAKSLASKTLLVPHHMQVICVLRMFGYDDQTSLGLHNQLMQIRTGEGKSIILGACSTLLGLLGFRVRCVCYSRYLSDRDAKSFSDIFQAFGVQELVTYSKIVDYSEDCIKAKGDIRGLTESLFRGELQPEREQAQLEDLTIKDFGMSGRQEVLLVDEVDVFFGEDFYGRVYPIVAETADPLARSLLEAVWKLREYANNAAYILSKIRDSDVFARLKDKYCTWKEFLDSELECMVKDLRNFKTPEHKYARDRDVEGKPCIG
jgi:hypothetical protein